MSKLYLDFYMYTRILVETPMESEMSEEKKTDEVMLGARVDADLHRQVKIKAAIEGRTIADVLRDLLSRWVAGNNGDKPKSDQKPDSR